MRALFFYKMDYIKIGIIKNSHGLDGEVKVLPVTEYPELFETLEVLMLAKETEIVKALRVSSVRQHNEFYLIKFENIDDIETAKKLSGYNIMYPANLLPELDENEYYWFEIKGFKVFDMENNFVGELEDYEETGSVEAFRIKSENEYFLISNNPYHVLKIDKINKRIVINRDGLISEDI
ncbi:16S rRNA processing protein RimM [Deferribacter desulfuricans SSM1]|uniref:Ribosome maturation factor RimM n=2 Tax=Deferribacter TaxID=53572 RepID=D3PAY7_DEFDS|nr:16S rRNA processing protein RimM [Deferribacter desulfuricans SSM1]